MKDTKQRILIEEHRIKYWELETKLETSSMKEQLQICEEILNEMKLTGTVSPHRVVGITSLAVSACLPCDKSKARKFFEQEYAALKVIFGENDPEVKECRDLLRCPTDRY